MSQAYCNRGHCARVAHTMEHLKHHAAHPSRARYQEKYLRPDSSTDDANN